MHDKRDTGIDRRIDGLVQSVTAVGLHLIRMFPADLMLFFPNGKRGEFILNNTQYRVLSSHNYLQDSCRLKV